MTYNGIWWDVKPCSTQLQDYPGGPVPEQTFTHSHLKTSLCDIDVCHHSEATIAVYSCYSAQKLVLGYYHIEGGILNRLRHCSKGILAWIIC